MNTMTDAERHEFFMTYVQDEIKRTHIEVDEETQKKIVSLMDYFGMESYRPIAKLLLQNWEALVDRIAHFTEGDLEPYRAMEEEIGLDATTIAMLMEVLEGEDTDKQRIVLENYVPR